VLDGLTAYRQKGLQPPAAVIDAVKEYELKSDNVMRFMESHTERDTNEAVSTTALHTSYSVWCGAERISTMSATNFSLALEERGYNLKRKRFIGANPKSCVLGVKYIFPNA
jgi:phage/plasmid-associated DNA primase